MHSYYGPSPNTSLLIIYFYLYYTTMNHGEFLISFLIDLQRIFRTEVVPKDLPYSQVQAIFIIPSDGIEMSELSWTLGLDNSTVTRLIERLEVKGFVIRKKNKSDTRSIIVSLKKKGMSIQKNIESKHLIVQI